MTYDSLLIFYRDENGVKKTRYVHRTEVPYYIIKDKESREAQYPPIFIEKEKVEKVIVHSDMLLRDIALRTDSLSFYDQFTGSDQKNLLKHPFIYNADMDIADRYIESFNDEFEADKSYQLHKCYFDIEVDLMEKGLSSKGYSGFPDESIAPCPINIITLFDEKTMEGHVFVLRNNLNPQISEFERTQNEIIEKVKEKISIEDEVFINNIFVSYYDTEVEMITGFFDTVHRIDPDYMLAWNEGFDVLTLLNRLKQKVGYEKSMSIVCDNKYMTVGDNIYLSPKAYYKQNKDVSIVDRMDEFVVLDGINWLDQMLLFANVRKAKIRESYTLDAIANEILGKEKLDYTGYTIKNLPWKNFIKFFEYNFRDTLLLHMLEVENLDVELIQRLSEITNTRQYKVFKKTISLKNYVSKFAEMQGFILGNNKNATYGSAGPYFEKEYIKTEAVKENNNSYLQTFSKKENYGAYVGDPNLNDYCGIKLIGGKRSMFLFENVFDEDFSSLYPSIIRAYNLDRNTQVGKFFLLDNHIKEKLIDNFDYDGLFPVSKNEEATGEENYTDIGPTLVDSLISHDWVKIGEKYFDLPSTTDMINELME